jgi:hypothetical protein
VSLESSNYIHQSQITYAFLFLLPDAVQKNVVDEKECIESEEDHLEERVVK